MTRWAVMALRPDHSGDMAAASSTCLAETRRLSKRFHRMIRLQLVATCNISVSTSRLRLARGRRAQALTVEFQLTDRPKRPKKTRELTDLSWVAVLSCFVSIAVDQRGRINDLNRNRRTRINQSRTVRHGIEAGMRTENWRTKITAERRREKREEFQIRMKINRELRADVEWEREK